MDTTSKKSTRKAVADIKNSTKTTKTSRIEEFEPTFDKVVSTGSTLLDLIISGKRIRGGGIPGGILAEITGPSSAGKTALLCEIAASTQIRGGDVDFADTEARLDRQYAKVYDFILSEINHGRPDTVNEMFDRILKWEPKPKIADAINMFAGDSMAALSTEIEMEEDDKMGMKRAKDFSKGCRKVCRMIHKKNWLVVFTNQERAGQNGSITTPCGNAIPYHASLRLRVAPVFQGSKIIEKRKIGEKNKEVQQVKGIISEVTVKKSSIDEPFRTAPIYIVFNRGIDDVRANLQWYKDMTGNTKYTCVDKEIGHMKDAIAYIEDNNKEEELRQQIMELWYDIDSQFKDDRKRKDRR